MSDTTMEQLLAALRGAGGVLTINGYRIEYVGEYPYNAPAPDSGITLTPAQLAKELGTTTSALAQLRYTGKGPKFAKLTARTVVYRREDVDEWIASKLRTRTDDPH